MIGVLRVKVVVSFATQLILACAALGAPQSEEAPVGTRKDPPPQVHRVEPGLAWHLVAKEAKPGDQILLEKGIHINGRVEGVHGTREKPIVIRGAEPGVPSAIACEETGVELIGCSWVRLENLYFINPLQAGILIDGSVEVDGRPQASEVSIAVSNCRIAASREIPGLDAIRVRRANTIGIADCRFEAWSDAAIELRTASKVIITRCLFSPSAESAHRFGVRALDGSESIAIVQNTFDRHVVTAVQVGACDEGGESIPPTSAKGVNLARSALLEVNCPIEVAGDSEGSLRECTIVDPAVGYRIDARCGTPKLEVQGCIFTWSPGQMNAPTERRGEVKDDMVALGANVWWSIELPAAFAAIGRPFGVEKAPQIFDVDPRLAERSFEPIEPRAQAFGWRAPVSPMSVPPSTTPPAAAPPATPPPATPEKPAESPRPGE